MKKRTVLLASKVIAAACLIAVNCLFSSTHVPDTATAETDSPSDAGIVPTTHVSPVRSPTDSGDEIIEYDIRFPYFLSIDKAGQVITAYTTNEEGKYEIPVRTFICSVNDALPAGYYPVKSVKYRRTQLEDGSYAQYVTKLTGCFIFRSVSYHSERNDSIDAQSFSRLGTAAGDGGIALTVECAKWIYDNCPAGTVVRVTDGEYDAALTVSLIPPSPVGGWDVTDPDADNPFYQPQYDTRTEAKPYIYTPVYDYKWEFSPEYKGA